MHGYGYWGWFEEETAEQQSTPLTKVASDSMMQVEASENIPSTPQNFSQVQILTNYLQW